MKTRNSIENIYAVIDLLKISRQNVKSLKFKAMVDSVITFLDYKTLDIALTKFNISDLI